MKSKRSQRIKIVHELPDNKFNQQLKSVYNDVIKNRGDFNRIVWSSKNKKFFIY